MAKIERQPLTTLVVLDQQHQVIIPIEDYDEETTRSLIRYSNSIRFILKICELGKDQKKQIKADLKKAGGYKLHTTIAKNLSMTLNLREHEILELPSDN